MFSVLFDFIEIIFNFLKYPLILFGFLVLVFLFSLAFNFFKNFKKIKLKPSSTVRAVPRISILKRLFVLAPRRIIKDIIERPPDFFNCSGLIIYEGRQGSGKTSTMVHDILNLQYQYPRLRTITNFSLKTQNSDLRHWKQLINYNNGYYGVVVGIDELQNWFSSKQSANFPPEMLSVVTQNRKNKRVIMGTAQNFYMLSKDIRTQCTELRRCKTFLGCITLVTRLRPICDSAGDIKDYDKIGRYFWVHTDLERDSYDTYKVIESLAKSGFKDIQSSASASPTPVLNINNIISKKGK